MIRARELAAHFRARDRKSAEWRRTHAALFHDKEIELSVEETLTPLEIEQLRTWLEQRAIERVESGDEEC